MATRRSPQDGLRQFQLEGVRDTGRTVGDGSYATVKELDFRGLKCVGKKIHTILYNSASPQEKVAMLERFASECELLSLLHHPCIVQFLGVYFEPGSQLPVMVMEYLHTTLSACLDNGVLPEEIGYEILRDVALGLRYLHEHSPPIVHRDLSANNVLLTPHMSAKISDLGVAKILNLSPARMGQMTQTQTPGTPCYMPPEAMVARPKYTNKVDIFSYGVMMVHVLSGQWPIPGEAFREDPRNPDTSVPVSEFDRRAEFLQGIGRDHSLMGLIRQCLSNTQSRRPEAVVIHEHISAFLGGLNPVFVNRADMIQHIKSLSERVETLRKNASQSSEEINSLRVQVEKLSVGREESQQSVAGLQQPHLLHPQARLQWRRCADLPLRIDGPKSVLHRGKVYVGSGNTDTDRENDLSLVFQYDPGRDGWSTLPPCPVMFFGLGQFQGHLITVGGISHDKKTTGKVHCYKEESQEWKEYLQPMPTARVFPSVITTESAIIACGGGVIESEDLNFLMTVEVYTTQTAQWHVADPLPTTYCSTACPTISDICYLLGDDTADSDIRSVLYAPVTSLVQKATSPSQQTTHQDGSNSLWKTLPDTPLRGSAAANLAGHLLAVGGYDDQGQFSPAVHVFIPPTNSWARLSGDLPTAVNTATAITLPGNRLLVCGGCESQEKVLKTVYMGTITLNH